MTAEETRRFKLRKKEIEEERKIASTVALRQLTFRKKAALSSLLHFSVIKPVRSMNNPFDCPKKEEKAILSSARRMVPNDIIHTNNATMTTGIGNCDEKARICYSSLARNPNLGGCYVTKCSAIGFDHVFVVVSDSLITDATDFSTLGKNVMVVDGWTEDWYFPNMSNYEIMQHPSFLNSPNPRQLVIRIKTKGHLFQPSNTPDWQENNNLLSMKDISPENLGVPALPSPAPRLKLVEVSPSILSSTSSLGFDPTKTTRLDI